MDSINSIHDTIVKNLRNENRIVTVSKLFTQLETDLERYELGSLLLDEFDISPAVDGPCHKNAGQSEKLRNEGNSAFLKGQDLNAIQCYTSSAGFAPNESRELALAYANRSAVTFALKQYDECLKDIDRALSGYYPDNLRYKLYERKGKCFKFTGDNESARENYIKSQEWLAKSNLKKDKQASYNSSLELSLSDLDKDCENMVVVRLGQLSEKLELSFPPNDEILCACDALKIEYSEEFGRHVVATKDILPGQILAIERPFASILLPTSYTEYCFHCLKRCHSLLPCTGCVKVFFCSASCREVSWRQSHCIDCSLLERLYNFGCSNLEILSVRTLILAARVDKFCDVIKMIDGLNKDVDPRQLGFNEQGKYDSSDYRASHCLARNTELRSPADLFRRVIFAVCAIHFIDRHTDFFEINSSPAKYDKCNGNDLLMMRCQAGGLLLRYMQIIPCNGHEVSEMCVTLGGERNNNPSTNLTTAPTPNYTPTPEDEEDGSKRSTSYFDYACNEIGSALYPFLSLINHSCDPNVVRHSYNGDAVVLSAIQGVRKGEQVSQNHPTSE
ncbi:SET and MYND domain-containing protein 4 [Nilaparvata lugens]|uniref:SET and MYND domain-containing protein 4 n=1 Tax=Nilaparvata lugens TaxID=108931 RepID=UPI00193E79A7|nr:SET and MYND domain-containing protein 4 [Nilaparvata lugens]